MKPIILEVDSKVGLKLHDVIKVNDEECIVMKKAPAGRHRILITLENYENWLNQVEI